VTEKNILKHELTVNEMLGEVDGDEVMFWRDNVNI
jgi:hypothetical protein